MIWRRLAIVGWFLKLFRIKN